jgi:hypothetical protein
MSFMKKALKEARAEKANIDRYFEEATSGDYNHLLMVTCKYVEVELMEREEQESRVACRPVFAQAVPLRIREEAHGPFYHFFPLPLPMFSLLKGVGKVKMIALFDELLAGGDFMERPTMAYLEVE